MTEREKPWDDRVGMDCREYVEEYLSADTDGELSEKERRAVAQHLEHCLGDCRDRFAAERLLKAWLKKRLPHVSVPPELRSKIIAALNRTPDSLGAALFGVPGRPRLWLLIAVAALAMLAALIARSLW